MRGATGLDRRWVAAFARQRTAADEVPKSLRTDARAFDRIQYAASRRLTIVGGGIDEAWIAPGGLPEEMSAASDDGQVCLLGPSILGQCKAGLKRWKKPIVEVVACSPAMTARNETFVWALTPPGATRLTLSGSGARTERLPAGELVAVRRSMAEQITTLTWTWPTGKRVHARVPWPRGGKPRCGDRPPAWRVLRRDSIGGYTMDGGPRNPHRALD